MRGYPCRHHRQPSHARITSRDTRRRHRIIVTTNDARRRHASVERITVTTSRRQVTGAAGSAHRERQRDDGQPPQRVKLEQLFGA
jgi:hypothetical protein